MAVYKGDASLSISGVNGNRRFSIRTVNSDGDPIDRASWQLDSGGTITLYYREQTTGLVPPDTADTVIIRVYVETGTGTLVRTLHNGAPPSNGQSFTFHGTANGLAGGGDRCGTLRLRIDAIRTSGAGGVGNYDRNSDDGGGSGLAASDFDQGALRVNAVTTFTHGGYPSGSTYAYGVSADETVTVIVNHPAPYVAAGSRSINVDVLDGADVQVNDVAAEPYAGTSTTAAVIVNNQFDDASKTYGIRATPIGNSALMPSDRWTFFKPGTGASAHTPSQTEDQTVFVVDPRISLASVASGELLYNHGEATLAQFRVRNARGEDITRGLRCRLRNSSNVVRSTQTLSGALKSLNYTLSSSEDGSFDFTGVQWDILVDPSDVASPPSANVFKVSQKYRIHSAMVQSTSHNDRLLNAVNPSSGLANYGETVTVTFYLGYARGDPLANASGIMVTFRDAATQTAEENDLGETTDANGRIVAEYATESSHLATFDFVGRDKKLNVVHLGNVTDDTVDGEWKLSSKLRLGTNATTPGNNLVVNHAETVYNRGEDIIFTSKVAFADGRPYIEPSLASIVRDDNKGVIQTVSIDPDNATGEFTQTYTPGTNDAAAKTLSGLDHGIRVTDDGNASDYATVWALSELIEFDDTWTGKADIDADNNGNPDTTEETDFFVGADVLYCKAKVRNVRGEPYDDAAITAWVRRNNAIEQGPVTGAQSQTESGFSGWQDLFYQFDVKAPAGVRDVRFAAARDGNTTNDLDVPVNFAPSYTGNLEMEFIADLYEKVGTTMRFQLTPIIYSTANGRQLLSEVNPAATVDIAPKLHIKQSTATGISPLAFPQTTMTTIGSTDHWEITATGLTPGKSYIAYVVMTLNGGQVTAELPFVAGAYKANRVKATFTPLGEIER